MSGWIWQWIDFGHAHPEMSKLAAGITHAALIVFLAWGIERIARHRPSSFRHSIWACAFCALVLLVPQALVSFPLRIPIRMSRVTDPVNSPSAVSLDVTMDLVSESETAAMDGGVDDTALDASGVEAVATAFVPEVKPASALRSPPTIQTPPTRSRFSLASTGILIYALGVALWLARILRSWVRLRRIAREASRFPDADTELVQTCMSRIGLEKMPDCRVSSAISSPLTFGMMHPVILVPRQFESFTADQRRHCLLHEMAHVVRRDAWWNWVAEITAAVYWFHPCVHWARIQLRRSREDAADDAVMRTGERPASYSRSLLEISQQIAGKMANPSVAIHSGTNLEQRIRRIVAPTLRLDQQPRWAVALLAAGFVSIAAISFSVESVVAQKPPLPNRTAETDRTSPPGNTSTPENLTAASTVVEPAEKETASVNEAGLFDRFRTANRFQPKTEATKRIEIQFQGQVVDDIGPVAGAVVLIREFVPSPNPNGNHTDPPIVARTMTDSAGRYEVDGVPIARLKSPVRARWEILVADRDGRLGLGAYALTSFTLRQPRPWNASVDIQLPGPESVTGRVIESDGNSLADVRVAVKEITVPESVRGDAGPFMDPERASLPKQPHRFSFPTDRIHLSAITAGDGQFTFRVPENASLVLGLKRAEFFPRLARLSAPGSPQASRLSGGMIELVSPATIPLRRLLEVPLSIRNPEGDPVKEFTLVALPSEGNAPTQRLQVTPDGTLRTTAEFLRSVAGPDGHVRLIATFPFDSGLVHLAQSVPAETIITEKGLQWNAQRGRQASGRVVVSDSGAGIGGVEVCWHQQPDRIEASPLSCQSDGQGRWQMVVPNERGFLSVIGSIAGMDLLTFDAFNEDTSETQRLTQRVASGAVGSALTVPDFHVDRIPPRIVTVVDSSGAAVPEVWVHSEHVETIQRNGKVYHLPQRLARPERTDADGRCSLVLNRTQWQHGSIKVIEYNDEDAEPSPAFIGAVKEITPDPGAPIKLVLREPWIVTGRVLIDGQPARGLQIGLTTRMIRSNDFGLFKTDTVTFDGDGNFELKGIAGPEYSVAVRKVSGDTPTYYYWQTPIAEVAPGRYSVGTLSIASDQLKTHQQLYDERYRNVAPNPGANE
ncbi:Regulatory protein BlaR1 [Stieleria maiorica]|uniref:Regulatory protein BlaR1 n=1 Tax=Stieleria maiorica TaxID=2795974 RepID=A0A5B9MCZ3_9BACT|nr:M56 family metallopeptidase [Stieleria maiorica]QEF98389.1 Regulatory protein BlaR1 [Stieleria maiorica]